MCGDFECIISTDPHRNFCAKFYCHPSLPNVETEAYRTFLMISKDKKLVNDRIRI